MVDTLAIKIVRVRDTPTLSPVGGVQRQKSVDYMVGEHGPFTVTLDDDGFTAQKARAAVDAAAKEIKATLS